MSITPPNLPLPSTDPQVEATAAVRPKDSPAPPASGNAPSGNATTSQDKHQADTRTQDVVKVHWDESGQVEIYQFVNRQGTVYLQVPSEQLLKLARQISIELARSATRKASAAAEGGNDQ